MLTRTNSFPLAFTYSFSILQLSFLFASVLLSYSFLFTRVLFNIMLHSSEERLVPIIRLESDEFPSTSSHTNRRKYMRYLENRMRTMSSHSGSLDFDFNFDISVALLSFVCMFSSTDKSQTELAFYVRFTKQKYMTH